MSQSSMENTSTPHRNASRSLEAVTSMNATIAFLIFMGFLTGTSANGLFLWVLGLKMKRTVNTLWFFHLILINVIFCSLLPFFAVFVLYGYDWIFGQIMCKLLFFTISVLIFTTVFLLTIISLDRYFFVCHPNWSQRYRRVPQAWRLVVGMWLISSTLNFPNLIFLETREVKDKRHCNNNFAFSNNWGDFQLHVAFFLINFFLAFLFPFFIIMGCYCWIGLEMKKKHLVKTRKPFRIFWAAVVSFFICWFPYHVYKASLLLSGISETVSHVLFDMAVAGGCFNICFTPIIYLFVGEKFQKVFKTSIFDLFHKAFVDYPIIQESKMNNTKELDHVHGKTSQEPKITKEDKLKRPLKTCVWVTPSENYT